MRTYGHPDRREAVERIRRAYGGNVQPLRTVVDTDREAM